MPLARNELPALGTLRRLAGKIGDATKNRDRQAVQCALSTEVRSRLDSWLTTQDANGLSVFSEWGAFKCQCNTAGEGSSPLLGLEILNGEPVGG